MKAQDQDQAAQKKDKRRLNLVLPASGIITASIRALLALFSVRVKRNPLLGRVLVREEKHSKLYGEYHHYK